MSFKNRTYLIARFVLILALSCGALVAVPADAQSTVYRVAPEGATSGSCGADWSNPCDLQYVLNTLAYQSSGLEVWAATGTYFPGVTRTHSFQLRNGVAIYGGFAGTESVRQERDHIVNITTLSGDLGMPGDGDNSYHVVTGTGTNSTAVLDGFTVTDGNAEIHNGGGLYNINGSPTLANITFRNNRGAYGGGIYNDSGNPTFINVIFQGNQAVYEGGGMYNISNSDPVLRNIVFIHNSAGFAGGGMVNNSGSNPTLTNGTFRNNSAPTWGGGMFNSNNSAPTLINVTFSLNSTSNSGGGMYNFASNPTLINVTFKDNRATMYGGGMANLHSDHVLMRNTILWQNIAPTGAQIYNDNSFPTISYSVVQDSGGSGSLWNPRLGNDGGDNLDAEPLLGPLQENGGFTQTMALSAGSPAIDAGDPIDCPSTDQRGVARPQGTGCDIGAYEAQPTSVIYYVKWDSTGANNGMSWTDAYTDLQSALSAAARGDEIWVAAGVYKPTTGTDRTQSFLLKNGVVVYGGFAGTETDRSQRDFEKNLTVLSGDIGASGDRSDNSYHVVVGSNTNSSAVLDGFTITGGNANGNSYPSDQSTGGGMYNNKGNPIIMNVIFSANSATFGGGMYNGGGCPTCSAPGSSPTLRNVNFYANSATLDGGGIRNETHSQPVLTHVTFSNNSAGRRGGGMQNIYDSNPTLTNVTFSHNTASAGGGMEVRDYSLPILTNVTFYANSASATGGAMDIRVGSWPVFNNVTISGNHADQGGGIYNNAPRTVINNSILYGNTGGEIYNAGGTVNVSYSIVQGGYPGTAILDVDPLLGPLQNNDSFTQTMALSANSPAIDAGKEDGGYNGNCPASDQRGIPRPRGYRCDIGAYEYWFSWTPPTPTPPTWVPSTSTATNTPILVPTWSKTPTGTSIFTPTKTNTPVGTPSATSTPISNCDIVYHGTLTIYGNSMSLSITNQIGIPLAVQEVFVIWDHDRGHSAGNDKSLTLQQASLNGTPFWTGTHNGPSITIAPSNVFIPSGNSTIRFTFHQAYDRSDGSEELFISLGTNGCQNNPIHSREAVIVTPIGVWIGGTQTGDHSVENGEALRVHYPAINDGPVKLMSTNMRSITGSEAVIYKVKGVQTSFSEMMGLPASQLDTTYWLPWYNNVDLDTQLRFANVSNSTATVYVSINGVQMTGSPFTLLAGQSIRKSFAGVNNGPVKIESNVNIVAAERVIYKVNKVNTSFTEMMALPNHQLDTTYWLPWYNNVDLDTQLRFANVSNQPASVHVFIGNTEMQGSPFTLQPGESTRQSFPNINNGPVQIVSTQNIVAAERVIYKVKGIRTSLSEMMALPNHLLSSTFWFPWYNNKDLDTQLRFGNVSDQTATVRVYIGGVEMVGSPFTLQPGESTRQSFPNINNGPVKIVSTQNIIAAERVIYKVNGTPTSFSEMMGLPHHLLSFTFWLPWYNNVDLISQLRFGVP